MKRTLLSVLLLAAALAGTQAQGTTLSLQNQENAWFYFVIDPVEMKGLSPTSPSLQGLVSQYFSRETGEFPFTPLQPLSGLKVEGLPEGTHLLVGFYVFEDRDEFPVRVVGLQVDGRMGERFYPLYSDPAILSAARNKGRLVRFARDAKPQAAPQAVVQEETAPAKKETVAVKEQPAAVVKEPVVTQKPAPQTAAVQAAATAAADTPTTAAKPARSEPAAPAFPPLAAFTAAFRPEIFTREDADGLQVLDISESKYWGKPGTGVREVRASLIDGSLRFTVSAQSPFARNVSYFLYAFPKRGPGAASPFTVEVKPAGSAGSGVAVLWEKGTGAPALYGAAAAAGDTVTVQLDLSAVPDRFWKTLGTDPSFDMTSCWFDAEAGAYEEYYLTSFSASDIPDR
jgi:hypothetical protein